MNSLQGALGNKCINGRFFINVISLALKIKQKQISELNIVCHFFKFYIEAKTVT